MRQMLLLSLCLAAGITAAASTPGHVSFNLPVGKAHQPVPSKVIETKVILSEDFSGFSAGSETAPGDPITATGAWQVPAGYTKIEGWRGIELRPAGGCVAVCPYVNYYGDQTQGYLSTPRFNLSGTATLKFRAKSGTGENGKLKVSIVDDDYDGILESAMFELTTEWKEFSFTSDKGYFNEYGIFQLNTQNGIVLLDDFEITRTNNKIGTPGEPYTENISQSSFKASWRSVPDAERYLFSCYYKAIPADAPAGGSICENFDNATQNADGSISGVADGWEVAVGKGNTGAISTAAATYGKSAPSVLLNQDGDYIMSPATPLPISKFSYWVKPTSSITDYDTSFAVYGYDSVTGKWEWLANIPNYWLNPDGEVRAHAGSAEVGENITRIKIEYCAYTDKPVNAFYFDDITIEYAPAPAPVYVIEDQEVKGTEYTVEGLDPTKDHWCTVKACNADLVSEASYPALFDGVADLTPKALDATAITASAFTANYEGLYRADTHVVTVNTLIDATSPMKDVVVLHEDFSGVNVGTIEQPEMLYGNTDLLEKGMTETHWMLTNPMLAAGMAGSTGTNVWMGTAGLVVSPRISLHNNGGKFSVTATAVTTEPDDAIWVMLLNDLTDSESSCALNHACPTPGEHTFTLDFANGGRENVLVAFMTQSGKGFFISDVTIRQDLNPGETLEAPLRSIVSESATSCRVDNLPEISDFTYTVAAQRTSDYQTYTSKTSQKVTVEMPKSGIDDVAASATFSVATAKGAAVITVDEASVAEIFDAAGRMVGRHSLVSGSNTVELPAGVYMIRCGSDVAKAVVR